MYREVVVFSVLLSTSVLCTIVDAPQVTTARVTTPRVTTTPTLKSSEKPNPSDYLRNKRLIIDWLLTGCVSEKANACAKYRSDGSTEYPGYDGWNNNIGHPERGAIDTPLVRRWPAAYEDGVYKPAGSNRPQPLELSEKLLSGDIGSQSRTGKNALLVFFGQQVVEEILDAQRPACPPEYFNIKIPEGHRYRDKTGHTKMPFQRTRYSMTTGHSPNNPRQQLNEITPFLDGGLIYGTSKAWSDVLRTYANGTMDPNGLLAFSRLNDADLDFPEYNVDRLPMANPPPPIHHRLYVERHYTEKVDRFFKLGNPRGNENPFLLTFGIIWFRWHNFVARTIKRHRPAWSGEKIYNEARKWVIATQQHIVTNEWLPEWLGNELPPYKGYDPNVDPQIEQFFQAAAFRFGHTLVTPGVYMRDYGENGCLLRQFNPAVRTCNNYWMSENSLHANLEKIEGVIDVERLIMGMAVQLAEKEDHKIIEDLRGHLFGPLEFPRRDLMALNIQRGRDHGLPDYNTARTAYNLTKVNHVSHFINVDDKIKEEFLRLHNNSFDNVDVWVGGIMETIDGPGELFQAIISDQFERIRAGDRFWYKNRNNGLFTADEIQRLEKLSFYNVLMAVTKMHPKDIPSKNPFKVPMFSQDIHPECLKNTLINGSCKTFFSDAFLPCYHIRQMDANILENCTDPGIYDYFSNSEISFISTFAGLIAVFAGLIISLLFKLNQKQHTQKRNRIQARQSYISREERTAMFTANEWEGKKVQLKPVIIILNAAKKMMEIKNQLGYPTRAIDFTHADKAMIYVASDHNFMMIRVRHNYDLVLKFDSGYLFNLFSKALDDFLLGIRVEKDATTSHLSAILKRTVTKKDRQKKLEKFFRVVFAQAFHITHTEDEILQVDASVAKEVVYTELTIGEFAEALSMRSDSEFVRKIFNLVDKDKNGFISFREFVDMLVIFLKGNADEKLKLMFDMYDINGTGRLKRDDFVHMLRSFMEIVNADVTDSELEALVHSMMEKADIARKEAIDLQDFQQILSDFNDKFNYAELEFNVNADGKNKVLHASSSTVKSTFIGEVRKTMESLYADPNEIKSRIEGKVNVQTIQRKKKDNMIDENEDIVKKKNVPSDRHWYPLLKYIANKQLQILWVSLYTLFLLGIFAERVYYYSIEREHTGLREILGYGLTITRGSASAMMFSYSTMIITTCQNTITLLRDTFLHRYIPFDNAIEMHKYIAFWALAFTVMHVIGHGFNFYHIATQPADDLTCLFPNYFHATHEFPKFHYWCWQTMTGITGILLTVIVGTIFICSHPYVRQKLYNWFSFGHSLYPMFYILMVLHGSGRLVQEPYFHYFFLGPIILFIIDKIVSASRKTIEIPILKADILPSNVTCITFPKPPNFQYKPGQWVRIACPALQTNEFHPFTLSSAPNEVHLTVHIRAVGAWTTNIRNKLDPSQTIDEKLPMIHVDGPYGESHQSWDKYNVAIMVGGGIGVTPFASILKDIVYKSNHNFNLGCKKVYFLWVTRTQKQFEWMVDILRDLERADMNNCVSAHVFITQFYQKFDLRTILLYICERHFQRVSNKSLFTGLTAVTHFGRPKFPQFFLSIQRLHAHVNKIGVFSCGTPAMTRSVDAACKSLNLTESTETLFQHYSKSF